ncbi:MAG: hypothetical protein ACRDZ6_06960 [Acidimicrobiales bacterium]
MTAAEPTPDDGVPFYGEETVESGQGGDEDDLLDDEYGDGEDHETDRAEDDQDEEATRRAPWHFKVIVVGSVVYLGWRAYQGIGWLVHHIH